ncbi:unnamed protein product [Nesidiocoris tenuis]|uniref:Reverse transcriptase Ty1/copia-type domain-containing protein n=1 Tax=Nesidiocoris tenuis TaxID=355587 RepID=A0A6H5HG50_9HEMI|nr:unnamed protein product [Nesidiocoris tenuis]
MTDNGMKVLFTRERAYIFNQENEELLSAKRINGLYFIEEADEEARNIDVDNGKKFTMGTRIDINYAVTHLSQFNNCFKEDHWKAAKRVLRYLKGTINYELTYSRNDDELKCYADADWGNCKIDRHSFSGYLFTLSGAAISWTSKKQRTVALSSLEAELVSLSESCKEAIYLRRFLDELGYPIKLPLLIHNDSQGAQATIRNPIYRSKTKHIDIRNNFIKQNLDEGIVNIQYLSTDEMVADFLTKSLSKMKHEFCTTSAGITDGSSVYKDADALST